jgi:hypothetical protein
VVHYQVEDQENLFNMEQEEVFDILKNYKNKSNKDLVNIMDFLSEDFEKTKDLLLKLSIHLDNTEESYNKILKEFNRRKNNG